MIYILFHNIKIMVIIIFGVRYIHTDSICDECYYYYCFSRC
jgi:hypothetical protein